MLEKKTALRAVHGYVGIGGKGPPSAESSRSGSPHTSSSSFIPQPKSALARDRPGFDKSRSRPSSTSSTSSIPHLPVKGSLGSTSSVTKCNTGKIPTGTNGSTVFDKLKFFNVREKNQSAERTKGIISTSNKRTSSSSGFSSARSERSDSSTSVCSEAKSGKSPEEKELISPQSFSKPPIINSNVSNIPSKHQIKKISCLPATKQIINKPKTADGKDSVSSKIDQLKSASRIAKEKRNEKLKSTEPSHPTTVKSDEDLNNTRNKPQESTDRTDSENKSDLKHNKSEIDLKPFTRTEQDYPIRQSKVVSNLKASTTQNVTSNLPVSTEKLNSLNSSQIIPSPSLPVMEANSNQQGNSMLMSSPGSSIPKPTAAVKGTSKVTKDDKNQHTNSQTPNPKNLQEKQVQGTKLTRDEIYVAVHIDGPNTQVLDTGQMESRMSSSLPKTERSRSDGKSGSQGNVSIAMVSPIMCSPQKKEKLDSPTLEKDKSSRSQKETPSGKSSKSVLKTRAEHIYETCEKLTSRDPRSNESSAIADEGDDVVLNIKPMQPLLRASPYGYMRTLGPLTSPRAAVQARMNPQSALRVHTEYGETGRLTSSRQFLASLDNARMYSIAMKRALSGCNSLVDTESYAPDSDIYDMASGYMSDGEILRPGMVKRADDIASGYLSEGGTPVYTRKAVTRQKDYVVPAERKEGKIIDVLQDDRIHPHAPMHRNGFDDSSSLSSGVSDIFPDLSTDDNLTGSSVSSDNAYSSLKRSTTDSRGHHNPRIHKLSSDKKGADDHFTYATTGTGSSSSKTKQAHVKKTDSSMQTDCSAFQRVSSSAWKKYMLQQQQQPNSQEGKNTSSEKAKDKKSSKQDAKKSSDSKGLSKDKHKSPRVDVLDPTKPSIAGSSESLNAGGSRKASRSTSVPQTTGSNSSKRAHAPNVNAQAPYSCNGALPPGAAHTAVNVRTRNVSSTPGTRNLPEKQSDCSRSTPEHHREHPDMAQCFAKPAALPSNAASSNPQRKGKVKVCANTQTNSSDLCSPAGGGVHSDNEYSSLGRKYPPKQYFMTTPGPGTGLKERVYGTRSVLNGSPTPMSDYVMLSSRTPRFSGPLRDIDNYATLEHSSVGSYSWMRHSPSCGTSVTSSSGINRAPALIEADSMESLSSTSSSIHAQIQHARANSLTHARLMLHQRELASSPRLSRSNSIRSTKSEKLPSYLLQRSNDEQDSQYQLPNTNSTVNSSQPTSPNSVPQGGGRYMFPMSPGTPSLPNSSSTSNHMSSRCSMSPYMSGLLTKMNSKDDEVHGSALSLVSTSSSIYSTAEDKQAHEIRKLKRELDQSHDKVSTLTSQLTTNAHMVAAFEQSLSNMTSRLQHLTASAEQKDSELIDLRKTIEALKKQSAEAGLTKMALQSMQAVQKTLQEHRISRQFSTDSVSSVNSYSSECSGQSGDPLKNKKKKKGWLRSSFSKAFSRSKKNKNGSVSDIEDIHNLQSDSSTPNSPLLGNMNHMNGGISAGQPTMKQSHSSSALYDKEEDESESPGVVKELKKELREKEMVLTDIRLDALSSAHQLENLKETVNRMRNEMSNLKHDNDRLQRLVSTKSLASSHSSLPMRTSTESLEKRLSTTEHTADLYLSRTEHDGKLVTVSVFLGCHGDSSYYQRLPTSAEVHVGTICISSKTQWDLLDTLVKRTFKDYVLQVDPVSNLGLTSESLVTYHIGEIVRSKDEDVPELLPYGYIVGDNMQIKIVLKGTKQHSVDALTFETLIPKSIVQRYISLLTEHRRIILCGPSGTGKTYIAQKMAEYLVLKNGKEVTAGAIATFSVDHKSAKELRQYLSNVAEQCETSNASDLPTVIILDNLHHVGSLGEVFNGFLSAKYQKCPYIIGTMNQATCSTTNLQLHHNFRWVLCANHMEPVKGFLSRYLKRKLIQEEVKAEIQCPDITKVIEWMPKVWQHLNKYLETYSSSDVTIGPRLFLSCPVDLSGSQVWFTDLWNYSIVPYLLEAVREGLQLYGRRAPWEDPADWVFETYPWPVQSQSLNDYPQLLRLRPEDVGYEGHPGPSVGSKTHLSGTRETEADPLWNMLMRLQEADASYSGPHSNDSDSTSLDSRGSSKHSDELLNSGLESIL